MTCLVEGIRTINSYRIFPRIGQDCFNTTVAVDVSLSTIEDAYWTWMLFFGQKCKKEKLLISVVWSWCHLESFINSSMRQINMAFTLHFESLTITHVSHKTQPIWYTPQWSENNFSITTIKCDIHATFATISAIPWVCMWKRIGTNHSAISMRHTVGRKYGLRLTSCDRLNVNFCCNLYHCAKLTTSSEQHDTHALLRMFCDQRLFQSNKLEHDVCNAKWLVLMCCRSVCTGVGFKTSLPVQTKDLNIAEVDHTDRIGRTAVIEHKCCVRPHYFAEEDRWDQTYIKGHNVCSRYTGVHIF